MIVASSPPTFTGLTTAEVRERVAKGLTNAYKPHVGRSYWDIVRDNLLNLFNIVLFTLLVVVLFFRDYATVFFAGFSVVTNSLLGMFQEMSAKRKLDQLAALQVKEARVWRDGKLIPLPINQIVCEDVIAIEPGERIVVDGMVLHSDALEIDESQLTGESDSVLKDKGDKVFSGSFCVAGVGVMQATEVGRLSTINKLAQLAKAYKHTLTPTQQKIVTIVQISVIIMAVVGPMVFVAGYINNLSLLEMFRNAVVFTTSLVPQGLVLTAILSLTIGAISITRFQTLIQRVNAVESMANVTVLCFDKTGTLTRNELAVSEVLPLNGASHEAVCRDLFAYTCNLGHQNRTASAVSDYIKDRVNGAVSPSKLREVPFTSARKWGAVVLPDETLIMGAPERVLQPGGDGQAVIEQAKELAAQGYRVLALARQAVPPEDSRLADNREALALVLLSDRVREDIQATLQMFREQNVALKVISGDNLETVRAIAMQAGMEPGTAYTGDQLEAMSEAELEAAAIEANMFARIEPDTKRKLITALKNRGQYVAMVGDGVNDVPALKAADLAIVMNDGAQISKDVGDIVLLNNAMSTLPLAFKEGRIITQTIYATSKLFLVKNLYSILFFVSAGFMAMPFPINPIQISWVTFGVINLPATLIAFRILRPEYMKRFRQDVLDYVINGGCIGAASLALLYAIVYFNSGYHQDTARTAITLYLALYGMLIMWHTEGIKLLQPRTILKHGLIFLLGLLLGAVTIAVPYVLPSLWPPVGRTFAFVPPEPVIWVLIVAIFLLSALLLEILTRTRALTSRLWSLSAP
jgi:cation-transporting P-type ATPase E